jgi:hypothetical protein
VPYSRLEALELGWNPLRDRGLEALLENERAFMHLNFLDLSILCLTDDGATSLASFNEHSLTRINLHHK